MSDVAFVVSCEHATARVPRPYRGLFAAHGDLLASHRGWDPGALQQARTLARRLDAPLFAARVTRLLVDANRSPGHPRLFSELTRGLPEHERERIMNRWWRPWRESVTRAVRAAERPVIHISVHSFTPVLDGRERPFDVAFLYDPRRVWERNLAAQWRRALRDRRPDLRVRRNVPYRGTSDGHTTTLRGALSDGRYAGLEIEVNQALTTGDPRRWRRLRDEIASVVTTSDGRPG